MADLRSFRIIFLQVSAVLLITIFVFNWNSFKLNSFKFVPETCTPPMIQPAFYYTSEHEEEYSVNKEKPNKEEYSVNKENLYRVLLRDIIQNKKWHGRTMIPNHHSTLFTAEKDCSFLNKHISSGGLNVSALASYSLSDVMLDWEWRLLKMPPLVDLMDAGNETTSNFVLLDNKPEYRYIFV